eukprot:5282587-Pyramimonas_sp.AAC.1
MSVMIGAMWACSTGGGIAILSVTGGTHSTAGRRCGTCSTACRGAILRAWKNRLGRAEIRDNFVAS